jgi:cytoskeleton protein RodZ
MGSLDTVQKEQLKAIGTYLNQVRQEQNLSLEAISEKTYIPLRLLKAIETAQEQPLPEPVFVQGFIRRYADALGLDGVDLSQKFPVHITPLPITTAATAISSSPEPRPKAAAESRYRSSAPVDEVAGTPRRQAEPAAYIPYIAAAALLAFGGIAMAVVKAISSRPSSRPEPTAVLPQQPQPTSPAYSVPSVTASPIGNAEANPSPASPSPANTAPSPQPTQAVSPKPASPKPASPQSEASPSPALGTTLGGATLGTSGSSAASNAPVQVEMQLTGESWVRVIVDGEVKAEAILPKGTRQSWSGKQQITIESGNAGAVSVAANGGTAKAMGELGAVEELVVKPK